MLEKQWLGIIFAIWSVLCCLDIDNGITYQVFHIVISYCGNQNILQFYLLILHNIFAILLNRTKLILFHVSHFYNHQSSPIQFLNSFSSRADQEVLNQQHHIFIYPNFKFSLNLLRKCWETRIWTICRQCSTLWYPNVHVFRAHNHSRVLVKLKLLFPVTVS